MVWLLLKDKITKKDNKKDKITKRRSFIAYLRTILRLAFSAEVKNKQKGSRFQNSISLR